MTETRPVVRSVTPVMARSVCVWGIWWGMWRVGGGVPNRSRHFRLPTPWSDGPKLKSQEVNTKRTGTTWIVMFTHSTQSSWDKMSTPSTSYCKWFWHLNKEYLLTLCKESQFIHDCLSVHTLNPYMITSQSTGVPVRVKTPCNTKMTLKDDNLWTSYTNWCDTLRWGVTPQLDLRRGVPTSLMWFGERPLSRSFSRVPLHRKSTTFEIHFIQLTEIF